MDSIYGQVVTEAGLAYDAFMGAHNLTEMDDMQNLVLGSEKGTPRVWVGNGLTRRHIEDETELAGLQWWIGQKGGDSTVHEFEDLRVLGVDITDQPTT